jgi:hypothetical protein
MSKQDKAQPVERVAGLAMQLSQGYLADYGAKRSRHDFTQRQLMSCLILRAYLNTTYRGVIEALAVSAPLRHQLGLADKLPHFTTLQKFSERSQVASIAQKLIVRIGELVAARNPAAAAAMDSTGLETSNASSYFNHRSGKATRRWVKVSVMILCGTLVPLAAVVDLGPSNDRVQVPQLLAQAQAGTRPVRLYADAGYDAEWIHEHCRDKWGVESVIKPNGQRADGQRNGRWRSLMSPEYLKKHGYGDRWAVESFFSGLKRTMGQSLRARKLSQLLTEATLKVLAYALRR